MSIGQSMNSGNDIEPEWDETIDEETSRCEQCNKYFKDIELESVEPHGLVVCNSCRRKLSSQEENKK